MKIVGVGIGPDMITPEAAGVIQQAGLVYGSPRALELAGEHICCETRTIKDYGRIHELPFDAVVLSTGDPNLSGLGKFAGPDDVVIPGISSLQVTCARMKVDLTDIVVVNVHGRDPTTAAVNFGQAITSGSTVFLLPSPNFGVDEVVSILESIRLDVPIAVLEKLGYPDEHVEVGTLEKPPKAESQLYCMIVGPALENDLNI
ncbi:MAG: cobalt-precorrin-7 (C(5))-methyltransferase [Methanosarcinales archaeon]|nr:cobalt-precorrin-7 (C(5))-methyltransferase [Methanosarcinales archaeon]